MHESDTLVCFNNHMGLWAIEPAYIRQAVSSVQDGTLVARDPSQMCMAVDYNAASGETVKTAAGGRYTRHANGLAVVRIDGPMMKGFSKFGGTSTIATRVALRSAVDDSKTRAIMIAADTPGGTVAGTQTLADAVTAAAEEKPVDVFVDDLLASAGVWATAGATEITASMSSRVGSVGVIASLVDSSEAAERDGVRVIEFSTGAYKGVGMEGRPVTDEHEAYMQALVDDMGAMFFAAVTNGRGVTGDQLAEITSAKIFSATQALALGLIDRVAGFEAAVESILSKASASTVSRRARAAAARARASS